MDCKTELLENLKLSQGPRSNRSIVEASCGPKVPLQVFESGGDTWDFSCILFFAFGNTLNFIWFGYAAQSLLEYDPKNPRQGVIINSPDGDDVYHGVPKLSSRQ
ncbi:putative legumain protein [Helianthus debilis subsp. tardiflorus]